MGVRHIAVFRFRDPTTVEDVAAISAALAGLPEVIPELQDYRFGPDLALSDRTWDYGVVADFADADGYEAYRAHPRHRAVLEEHIAPRLADRASAQIAF